jgi:4-oxalocrotonate tautomerase
MPIVRVEMSMGRSADKKERFVREVTTLVAEVLRCPTESVDVIFTEVDGRNWARGGKFYAPSQVPDENDASGSQFST